MSSTSSRHAHSGASTSSGRHLCQLRHVRDLIRLRRLDVDLGAEVVELHRHGRGHLLGIRPGGGDLRRVVERHPADEPILPDPDVGWDLRHPCLFGQLLNRRPHLLTLLGRHLISQLVELDRAAVVGRLDAANLLASDLLDGRTRRAEVVERPRRIALAELLKLGQVDAGLLSERLQVELEPRPTLR
jgi:hypothetical protein